MKKAIAISLLYYFLILLVNCGPLVTTPSPPRPKLHIKYPLSERDIEEAIKEGLDGKRASVYLKDQAAYFLGKLGLEASYGFAIAILTPYARICDAALDAKRNHMNFTREDVTEGMLAPVVLIVAFPNRPLSLTDEDVKYGQDVENVILADIQKTLIIQPSAIEFFDEELINLAGTIFTYWGAYVEFPIEKLIIVSNKDEGGDFFIKVIGTRSYKEFRIKQHHLKNIK